MKAKPALVLALLIAGMMNTNLAPAQTNPTPARVINLSLGGGSTCGVTLQSAVNEAIAAGSVVVAATGNEIVGTRQFPFPLKS